MTIDFYGDPACSWSQVAMQWLEVVEAETRLAVRLRPYSLLFRDEGTELLPVQVERRTASLRLLRVLAGVGERQARALWDVVTADYAARLLADVSEACRDAGVDEAGSALADDEGQDAAVRAAMAEADALVGPSPRLPVLVLDGSVGFTGPLLRARPSADDAVRLWDAVLAMAATPGFYGLSRPHPAHPHAPFAPTPEPPVLS